MNMDFVLFCSNNSNICIQRNCLFKGDPLFVILFCRNVFFSLFYFLKKEDTSKIKSLFG